MDDYLREGLPIPDSLLPYIPPFLIPQKNFKADGPEDAPPISPEDCIEKETEINVDEKNAIESLGHKESTPTTQSLSLESSSSGYNGKKKINKISKTNKTKKGKINKKKNAEKNLKRVSKKSSRKSLISANVTEIFSSQFTAYEIFKADFVKAIVDYTKEPEAHEVRNSFGGIENRKRDDSSSSVEPETTTKNFDDEEEEVEECDYKGLTCRHFGKSKMPHNLIIAASKEATYKSIYKLLRASFKYVDRVMLNTDYGSFVILRRCSWCQIRYLVVNACATNVNAFRYLEFCCETEYSQSNTFKNLRTAVSYIIDARKIKKRLAKARKNFIKNFLLDDMQRNLDSSKIC